MIENLPSVVLDTLRLLQSRKYHMDKAGTRGRPVFESIDEVALTYYAIKNTDISKVARAINYEIPALWRVIKKIEEGKVSYWDTKESRIVTLVVNPSELIQRAEELIRPKGKRLIKAVTDSEVIQEFIANPERISKSKIRMYTKRQVRDIVRKINDIAEATEKYRDVFERYGVEFSNNPDMWVLNRQYEKVLSDIIDRVCTERYSDQIKAKQCKADYKMSFRKVPKFRNWFEGEIGAVRQRVKPIPETLWFSDYVKLKKHLLSSGKKEDRALWSIIALHITLGCREGYGSLREELYRLETKGINVNKSLNEIDLDEDIVNSSLIGLKFSNVLVKDNKIRGIDIYESKTERTWSLLDLWLDDDLEKYLLEVREFAMKNNIKSVVKAILMYEGLNGKWTVARFARWYNNRVRKITKDVLGKELNPHRLRSAHVSILAEFGVPLELVCSNSGFGVGWEDLSTAMVFYLRFSRQKIDEYLTRIRELRK